MRSVAGALPLLILWGAPLALGLVFGLMPLLDTEAWHALFAHPQLWPSLGLSLLIGTTALAFASAAALWIVAGLHGTWAWRHMSGAAGTLLALPHLAFAIGFGFLLMPAGLFARLLAMLFGWTDPPQWVATQDPLGLSLTAALTLKEIPFLVWVIWTIVAQGGNSQVFDGHIRAARSLGHGMGSIWLRVLIPQLLPRMKWPLAIVWVYGASVVDMALAIGPTQPPPFAVIVWSDLNNAYAALNARGEAGALLLTLLLALAGALAFIAVRLAGPYAKDHWTTGPSQTGVAGGASRALLAALILIYALTAGVLIIMSVSFRWPFPEVFPATTSLRWWSAIASDALPLAASMSIALVCAVLSIVLASLWFECVPVRFDRALVAAAVAAIAVPSLLVASGQYRSFLGLGLTGSAVGLVLAHFTPAFAYAVIVLKGPYRAYDRRYRSVALGLNSGGFRFWAEVKAPMLRPALAGAASVAFAVAIAQFIPAQLMAAGRISTLPMEAVTLTSGGNRPLTAVYALALTLPPAIAFLAAGLYGRPRWG